MTSPTQQRDDLSALLDGELENAELAAIEQELESDSDLRVELEELRGISDGLRSLPDATAPDETAPDATAPQVGKKRKQ